MHRNLLIYSNSIKNMFTGNIFWPSTIGQTVYLKASCVDRQDRLPGLSFHRVYNLARKIQSPKRLVQLYNHSMVDVMRKNVRGIWHFWARTSYHLEAHIMETRAYVSPCTRSIFLVRETTVPSWTPGLEDVPGRSTFKLKTFPPTVPFCFL